MGLEEYKGVFVFAQQVDNVLDGVAFELLGKGKELAKDLNTEVTVWGRADLKDVDDSNLGLKGSPTKIAKASDKVRKGAGEKVALDTDEAVSYLIGKFKEKHII